MLAPDSRTLLIDQLAPPPGHKFDRAVATTFTLDLTATLLPALAFTGHHLAGSVSDPIATLEAIRSTADRMDVFCQAGAIGVPDKAPDLLAFLEPMVHPVRPPSPHGLFHPKVWFIRYVDDSGAPTYRLLVLTRNLTMDSSWDLAVRLDADRVTDAEQEESAGLRDFLLSLPDRATQPLTATQRQRIVALGDEAGRISWELPNKVDTVLTHFLDPGRAATADFRGKRHLVVSPFLDATGLAHIRSGGKIQVLSRAEELEKLDQSVTGRLCARVLDDLAVVQQVEGSRLGGQLHAKMYVVEQTTNWSKAHVFIGSANATHAAFHLNTEFLLEMRGPKKHLGIDRFLGDEGSFVSLTQPYTPTGEAVDEQEDALQRELDNALRRVAGMAFTVAVLRSRPEEGIHDLRLRSERKFSLDSGWHAMVELLTIGDHATPVRPHEELDAVVPDVDTADVTPFLAVRVESPTGRTASTVVVAELLNAPEDRLDVVLARQIDTPEKFLRFLFFLLSLGDPVALAKLGTSSKGWDAGATPFGNGGSGVLEMVLGALATRPSALEDLDALVSRLASTDAGLKSLPADFLEFWQVVRVAAGLSREERP